MNLSEKSMKLSEITMKNMEYVKISEKMMDLEKKIIYCCYKKDIFRMRWQN